VRIVHVKDAVPVPAYESGHSPCGGEIRFASEFDRVDAGSGFPEPFFKLAARLAYETYTVSAPVKALREVASLPLTTAPTFHCIYMKHAKHAVYSKSVS
jgi:hypothetical protein